MEFCGFTGNDAAIFIAANSYMGEQYDKDDYASDLQFEEFANYVKECISYPNDDTRDLFVELLGRLPNDLEIKAIFDLKFDGFKAPQIAREIYDSVINDLWSISQESE